MEWAFAAGELCLAEDPAPLLAAAATKFRAWEVTGEGRLATEEGSAALLAVLPSFDLRLTFHASWRGVDLAAMDTRIREGHVLRLGGQVRLARKLGASAVVVHPGERALRGIEDPGALDRSLASLQGLAEVARAEGVELRVENMPRGPVELAQGPGDLRALAERADIAACWDLGHEHTLEAPPELGPILERVREVHLHDNRGQGDDHATLASSSTWVRDRLPILARASPGLRVTFEHRTVAECLASLAAAQTLLP